MSEECANSKIESTESADAMLARFFECSEAARLAAGCLREGAEAAIAFAELPGDWRFAATAGGAYVFEAGTAQDPDFELRLSRGAVAAICAHPEADLGDLGVSFFEHIVARDPDRKIHVKVRSGLVKLTRRGWLGVLARGGSKVAGWMVTKGLRGPGAIATALARLKA
jgi:hypothetical protein